MLRSPKLTDLDRPPVDLWVVVPCRHSVRFCGRPNVSLAMRPVPAPATCHKSSVARAHARAFASTIAPDSPAPVRARSCLPARTALALGAHLRMLSITGASESNFHHVISRAFVGGGLSAVRLWARVRVQQHVCDGGAVCGRHVCSGGECEL